MAQIASSSQVGQARIADEFVHRATRAFAHGSTCPPPPDDDLWVGPAITGGVLMPVVRTVQRSGHPLAPGLKRLALEAAARHLRTVQDLTTLVGALDGAGIAHAVLKGPMLRSIVFEQTDVRDYTDLDVLVSPDQLRATLHVLEGIGAALLPTDWEHITQARTAELALVLANGTLLDLHCHLVNRGRARDGYRFTTGDLLSRRVARNLSGLRCTTLDDLDFVLHVALHACLSGCTQLRWLLDVQQCTRWLAADPLELAERATRLGLVLPVRAALDSVVSNLDARVQPWAEVMGAATPWSRTLVQLDQQRPPSMTSRRHRTARTWYSATRGTEAGSWRSAGQAVALAVRYARSPWPAPSPVEVSMSDHGLQMWLGQAEQIR